MLAIAVLMAAAGIVSARDTEQTDSLVRLTKAKSLELIEKHGVKYRKAIDATFLHNGTYLICDTALWHVDSKLINCYGNVRLIQDETILTSDRLDYFVDDDLAQFRGSLVQLENKKSNTLRTRNLDYNTKDSIAIFRGGASMRDADGQIIESLEGTYETAGKLFTFTRNVNMFTDSVFVRTSLLKYDGNAELVTFPSYIDFWKDGNMLSASTGWYNRGKEIFFFKGNVHGLTKTQETWSDSLFYYRKFNDVNMLGNAQVQDTSRNVTGLADYIYYTDSLARIELRRRAAVAMRTEEDSKVDTLYLGADTLVYRSVKKCDIPEGTISQSSARLKEILSDAVTAYRRRAAEEAAAAAKRAQEEADAKAGKPAGNKALKTQGGAKAAESAKSAAASQKAEAEEEKKEQTSEGQLTEGQDSTGVEAQLPPPDTTKIGFFTGIGKVKMFRADMQMLCDSLYYTDLDSIACMYKNPIVWNEKVRQYSADSLFVLVQGGHAERASLMSNAFIHTKENELYFDQIKSTDVMVFFDKDSQLKRFDALGGVNALFYLEENKEIATVNRVEAKMLSATLVDGQVDRVHYFDSPKNDAFPVVQLPEADHRLKGYSWKPELRPASKEDITDLQIKASERKDYEARPKTTFFETDIYFPGYMQKVYRDIEQSRLKRSAARKEETDTIPADSLKKVPSDTLKTAAPDSLKTSATDSLKVAVSDSLKTALPDSLKLQPSDSLKTQADTAAKLPTKRELREAARAEREAAREARWAAQDAKDAARAAKKAEKALRRKREMTRKLYMKQKKNEAEEQRWLQKYIEYYQKLKDKEDEKQLPTAAGGDAVLGDTRHSDGDSVLGGGSLPGPESRPGI